jgi:hypothetical protein
MSLVTDIQELIEEAATGVFWVNQQVYDAANQALIDTWLATRHDRTTASMAVSTNDVFANVPTEIMIPERIIINSLEYFPTTFALLERENRNWRSAAAAQPKWFVMWDTSRFRLVPKANAGYTFTVVGVQYPQEEITASVTDITAPALLKQAVAHRAAGIIFELTRPDLADAMRAQATELEMEFKKQLRNRGGHRIDRLRPSTKFTIAQSGVIRNAAPFN